jgi:hypothetical protein
MSESRGDAVSLREGTWLFWCCAALALLLHAVVLLRSPELIAGGDLPPHLRLMQWNAEELALRNVYAPFYDLLGGLLAGTVSLLHFPKWFALASAAAYLLGFRFFVRSAKLPDTAGALLALSPYALSASWCLPKVEFFAYALAFVGLAFLLRRQYVAVAVMLALVFTVHTAVALVFGFVAGVLAIASRDMRGLAALAVGTLGAVPLVAAHMADGCSLAEALLFNRSGYWDSPNTGLVPENWQSILLLASPVLVVVAGFGAPALWRRSVPLACMAAALLLIYTNQAWMAPFGVRSVVGFDRGLPLLAVPVAMAAGLYLEGDRWVRWIVVGISALWLVTTTATVLPASCFVRPIAEAELSGLQVERCSFTWRSPARKPEGRVLGGAPSVSR